MFYLKNDDMEELFRKAAENYEVDTGKASNWEAINDALHNNSNNNSEDANKKKKRRFIFWWFLLFPAGWMAHNTWTNVGDGDAAAYKQYAAPVQYVPVNKEQQKIQPPATGQSAIRKEVFEQPVIKEKEAIGRREGDADNTAKENDAVPVEKTVKQQSVAANETNNIKKVNKPGAAKSFAINNKKKLTGNTVVNNYQKEKSTLAQNNLTAKPLFEKNKRNRSNASEKNNVYPQYSKPQDDNAIINASQQWVNNDLWWTLPPVENSALILQKITPDYKPLFIGNDSTAKQNTVRLQKEKIHYFYLEALASPDLTAVKLQHIAGTGSSFGLIVGYRFNKRLHIEVGAFLEKKVYYTKGKYFDTSKLSDYLRSVEILDVNGNCKMITVPVNIRYNLLTNAKRNWFVATGVSSYFMNSEYYDYNVKHPGGQPYVTSKGYKVSEKDWLSVINISVGYERTFWKSYNLRVEPYFRVPLSGVGTGNLSLSSAGVYIGIGRRF